MTTTKILTTLALAAVVAPGAALAAQSGDVGPQQTLKAGQKSPIRIIGTDVRKGDTLKKGQKLVFRTVEVQPGDTARFTISCGKGYEHQGLTPTEGGPILNLDQKASYLGKRSVKLRADGEKGRKARGTMYALCGR